MPLQATSGAASYDAYGGGVAVVPNYIEDVFSTFLTLGAGTTATITNGIDLSGKGGLVWLKDRTGAGYHSLADTARSGKRLFSNDTSAEVSSYPFVFTSTGFTADGNLLDSGRNFVSWTFRKQPKFFDVVTYTGNGTAGRTVAHNLGSVPGCIIVKNTSASGDWWNVYHRSLGATKALFLNDTQAAGTYTNVWNDTAPTSTVFSLGTSGETNRNGNTFVAYLFAHDAGGFGLTGTDNVISCGSYTGNATSGVTVSLGYEPQWLMIKNTTTGNSNAGWYINDNMRGLPVPPSLSLVRLQANTSGAEETSASSSGVPQITATGFNLSANSSTGYNNTGDTFIYIAIRRGPMKVPTTGTSVFSPVARTGTGSSTSVTGIGFPPELVLYKGRSYSTNLCLEDKLRGATNYLCTANTGAENQFGASTMLTSFLQDGFQIGSDNFGAINTSSSTYINYCLRRAPSFMDVVCYTGTGSARTVSHNLAAVPEMAIIKCRSNLDTTWNTYHTGLAYFGNGIDLQLTDAVRGAGPFSAAPTATLFTPQTGGGTFVDANASGNTYVAYLFATCSGVSKVGTYTGTGALQTVNCGFTGGARFVLIKRKDSTGDWWTYDSARGITSGNDPYLFLNSTAAEVTSTNYVDTDSTGFKVTAAAPAGLNASGGTYIFLAIS